MIALPPETKVWLAADVTDMRRSFDGLSAQVQTVLQLNPLSGHVFVFRGRSGDRMKVLFWDGQGMCVHRLTRFTLQTHREDDVCLAEGARRRRPTKQNYRQSINHAGSADKFVGRHGLPINAGGASGSAAHAGYLVFCCVTLFDILDFGRCGVLYTYERCIAY